MAWGGFRALLAWHCGAKRPDLLFNFSLVAQPWWQLLLEKHFREKLYSPACLLHFPIVLNLFLATSTTAKLSFAKKNLRDPTLPVRTVV